jgi:hypothetical protein
VISNDNRSRAKVPASPLIEMGTFCYRGASLEKQLNRKGTEERIQ